MERRKEPRVDVGIPIQIKVHQFELEGDYHGQTIDGTLIDMSGNGIQLMSATPLAQDMFMVLHMPEDADLPPLNARIIRVLQSEGGEHYHYGCMLSAVPPFLHKQLETYIEQYRNHL